MGLPWITTQIDSLDANAGTSLTEDVNVQSPSSLIFSGGTPTTPPDTGIASTTPAVSALPTWALYLFVASLAYFGSKELS